MLELKKGCGKSKKDSYKQWQQGTRTCHSKQVALISGQGQAGVFSHDSQAWLSQFPSCPASVELNVSAVLFGAQFHDKLDVLSSAQREKAKILSSLQSVPMPV